MKKSIDEEKMIKECLSRALAKLNETHATLQDAHSTMGQIYDTDSKIEKMILHDYRRHIEMALMHISESCSEIGMMKEHIEQNLDNKCAYDGCEKKTSYKQVICDDCHTRQISKRQL